MTESSARTLEQMRNMAERLSANPSYMAWILTAYKKQERASDAKLLEALNTTTNMLYRLALCRRPSSQEVGFADGLRQLATYTSIDPLLLASLIRQVESLESLGAMPNKIEPAVNNQRASASAGVLAAARDRDEDDQPVSPSQDTADGEESPGDDQT